MVPQRVLSHLPIVRVQADSASATIEAYAVKGLVDYVDFNSSQPCDLNGTTTTSMTAATTTYVTPELLRLNNCTLLSSVGGSGIGGGITGEIEDPNFSEMRTLLYQWLIVISSLAMLVSVFISLLVLCSARYIRKITPTVFFSLSLVAANAYAVITYTGSMAINSYLPVVYEWSPNLCWALLLEVFRMTGLTSSALHLLALAINHYVGILRPLHYASTVTRRRLTLVIVALWVIPFITYALILLNHPENDFRQLHCHYAFMTHLPYRVTVSSLFFAPLVIMTFLYIHIFITVKRNHRGFLMGQKNHASGSHLHIKRNVKAVITTLLILGTYLIGYMPAIVFYALTCNECPCPLTSLGVRTRVGFGIATNSLIFVKCLCDPIIYTVRMPEVRNGLRRMWLMRCCSKYLPAGTGMLDSERKRTVTSLRSDTIPLNRRSLQDQRERRKELRGSATGGTAAAAAAAAGAGRTVTAGAGRTATAMAGSSTLLLAALPSSSSPPPAGAAAAAVVSSSTMAMTTTTSMSTPTPTLTMTTHIGQPAHSTALIAHSGHRHLCARTSRHAPDQTVTAFA